MIVCAPDMTVDIAARLGVAYSIAAATYSDRSSMRMIEIRFLGRPVKI